MSFSRRPDLVSYLSNAHSIEEQAIVQLQRAPGVAHDPMLRRAFEQHLDETRNQERMVAGRLNALGSTPSRVKDFAGRLGGLPMVWFARCNTDTPGKLTAHAFSYEYMEVAAYELLERIAMRAGDEETARMSRTIALQERAMACRLEAGFPNAVDASLEAAGRDDPDALLDSYLKDAHAIESQAIGLLDTAPSLIGEPELVQLVAAHLDDTRRQSMQLDGCLARRGSRRSIVKDAGLRIGAIGNAAFFGAQADTALKLIGFLFAFEHLEVAGYEMLARVADIAGDPETAEVARAICEEERAMAAAVRDLFDAVVDYTLAGQEVADSR